MTEKHDQYWTKILSTIEKYGWFAQIVGGTDNAPWFAYTIGLSDKNLPELLITGLHPEKAHEFINLVGKGLVAKKFEAHDGELLNGILTVTLMLRELNVRDIEEIMTGFIQYAGDSTKPMKYMQVLFPDANGKFPGDPDCNSDYAMLQSLAGLK